MSACARALPPRSALAGVSTTPPPALAAFTALAGLRQRRRGDGARSTELPGVAVWGAAGGLVGVVAVRQHAAHSVHALGAAADAGGAAEPLQRMKQGAAWTGVDVGACCMALCAECAMAARAVAQFFADGRTPLHPGLPGQERFRSSRCAAHAAALRACGAQAVAV